MLRSRLDFFEGLGLRRLDDLVAFLRIADDPQRVDARAGARLEVEIRASRLAIDADDGGHPHGQIGVGVGLLAERAEAVGEPGYDVLAGDVDAPCAGGNLDTLPRA